MQNHTALITGASEGLGKSLAIELASRQFNLVLASLPNSGLPQLAAYLKRNFQVDVIAVETDLTQVDQCVQLFSMLNEKQIRVSMLLNNAGLGNWSAFEEKKLNFYQRQIELNVLAPVLLTRMFLEQLDKSQMNYIMNVGSLGALFLVPRKQVYGATKSFIRYFTHCLRLELGESNVKVSLLSPGGINTKPELLVMNSKLKGLSGATILEPEQVAREAITGLLKGQKEIVPGLMNRVLVLLNMLLPVGFKEAIIRRKLAMNPSLTTR